METINEQHLSYRATGDVIVLDGDGSRWVREGEATCPSWARASTFPWTRMGTSCRSLRGGVT